MLVVPTMNILDDKYTILYKYVLENHLPKKFFAIINNKVFTVYDALIDDTLRKYFDALDLLMVYFESTLNLEEVQGYKKWYLKMQENTRRYNKFMNAIEQEALSEYDTKDIISRYEELYGKNAKLTNYFKSIPVVVYYETDDDNIDMLLDNYHKKKNIAIFGDLFTPEDYTYGEFEASIVPNAVKLEKLLSFMGEFETLSYVKYDSKSFLDAYKEWIINTAQILQKDEKNAQLLTKKQHTNDVKKDIKISPRTVEKLIKIYIPYVDNGILDVHSGIQLFNDSVVSPSVPIVVFRNKEHTYYKTHTSYRDPLIPVVEPNTIYFYILRNNGKDGVKVYDVTYYLEANRMHITFNEFGEVDIDSLISGILPLRIDDTVANDYQMDGYFHVWDMEINEAALQHIVLNNTSLNGVLFVDDHMRNLAKNHVFLVHVPLLSNEHIHVEITQSYYESNKNVVYLEDGVEKSLALKGNLIPYLKINFKNVYHYEGFIETILMMLNHYHNMDEYDFASILTLPDTTDKNINVNLKLLKDIAPDAFVPGYANFCGKNPQPINEEDIEDYVEGKVRSLGLTGKKADEFRQNAVLDFPVKNQVLHLVCDYAEDIFPYTKSTNTKHKMKELDTNVYTELPCCKKLPVKQKVIKQETTHVIGHGIISIPGSYGQIPDNIKYVLNKYNADDTNNLIRMGVIVDNYSFLHCLCVATDDISYINTKAKSEYVKKLVPLIADQTHAGLLKQENYDLEDDVIKNNLLTCFTSNITLIPSLYYRAFEEYFNVNIYVFVPETIIEIPRYKLFHTRPVREERKTVLIYKHADGHCELIINKYADTKRVIIYTRDMTNYVHQFLQNKMNILTFTINNKNNKNNVKNITTYSNLYSNINTLTFFSNLPSNIYQYIDSNGKLQGLTVYFVKKGRNMKMSLLTFPSQPENLVSTNLIEYIDMNDALSLFTQKPSGAYYRNGIIMGLWYALFDIEFGVYVPVTNGNNMVLKPGPRHILVPEEAIIKQRGYLETKKLLSILTQIITWIYLVTKYKFNTIYSVDEFVDMYCTLEEINNNAYYDILGIPYRLPNYNKLDNYFLHIHRYCKDLVRDNKLIIYGLPLYTMIKKHIALATFVYNDIYDIPITIKGYYTHVSDFKQQPETMIFLTINTLQAWLNQHNNVIYQTILPIQVYPYLFKDANNNLYIIQNVKNNSLNEVLNVVDEWVKNKNNIGYYPAVQNIQIEPSIYKPILLSKYNKNINHLDLVVRGNKDYKILDYKFADGKVGVYAALLPL